MSAREFLPDFLVLILVLRPYLRFREFLEGIDVRGVDDHAAWLEFLLRAFERFITLDRMAVARLRFLAGCEEKLLFVRGQRLPERKVDRQHRCAVVVPRQ